MKTIKNKFAAKKINGNPFDHALIRLGHHFVPQQPIPVPVNANKK